MTVDDVLVRHLREARAELLSARVRIDADIQQIDRLIAARDDEPLTTQAALSLGTEARPTEAPAKEEPRALRQLSPSTSSGTPTVKQAILQVLRSEDREWHLREIVAAVQGLGVDAKEASVRSVVSRVVRDGKAVKGKSGRSFYRAVPDVGVSHTHDEPTAEPQHTSDDGRDDVDDLVDEIDEVIASVPPEVWTSLAGLEVRQDDQGSPM